MTTALIFTLGFIAFPALLFSLGATFKALSYFEPMPFEH